MAREGQVPRQRQRLTADRDGAVTFLGEGEVAQKETNVTSEPKCK